MTNPEERKNANSMKLRRTTKEEFISHITDKKEDRFAKTFVAKANMQDIWDNCYGIWQDDVLLGAIITTVSKASPRIMNLQLLHTFHSSRGMGVGKMLCGWALQKAYDENVEYFRVSAEPDAVVFYQKCGFVFQGRQKSNSQLSIFRIVDNSFTNGDYSISDPIIHKAVYRKGKGGCVEVFVQPEQSSLEKFYG